MGLPYQCIKRCGQVLVAARGSSIDTFNLEVGTLLSVLTVSSAQDPKIVNSSSDKYQSNLQSQMLEASEDVVLQNSPPAKRRKLSTAEDEEEGSAQESNQKNRSEKGSKRLDAVASALETPAVILLEATGDGRHVIVVTSEDKCIRVFQHDLGGLKQLSERVMSKRPCAIAITADDSTIISADKFGDVYSLPLLIPETGLKLCAPTPELTSERLFVPAANNLTVHSQRNLKALENQKKHSNRPGEKTEPTFEHKLLLGHVSMLTDLALITLRERNYILTADRDEHIRVSRGIPQAHIIEGFCLGHTEFISRLCVPKNRPEVLISGGGDDELFVWDWMKGVVASRADLRPHVAVILRESGGEAVENGSTKISKFAVSGIVHVSQVGNKGIEDLVVVTCEGVPAIFVLLLTIQNQLQHLQTLKIPGNALDIATDDANGLVLSIDTIHNSGSTTERRKPAIDSIESLRRFGFQGRELVPSDVVFDSSKADVEDTGRLTNLFYGLENLRKREGDGDVKENLLGSL